jgi:hypothetical protein
MRNDDEDAGLYDPESADATEAGEQFDLDHIETGEPLIRGPRTTDEYPD